MQLPQNQNQHLMLDIPEKIPDEEIFNFFAFIAF
jgi:hypothetical protein